MKHNHEKPHRVAEPVQVYLERPDASRLERLAAQLGATKSEVLRRGLAALERALSDPAAHPALRLTGMIERETAAPARADVARAHDHTLAEAEIAAWRPRTRRRKSRGG